MTQDLAKKEATALATLQAQLKEQALVQAEDTEASTGNNIKATHQGFEVPGMLEPVPAPLDVIVLAFVSRKEYYDTPYDPNNITPPACAAIGQHKFDSLVPFADAPKKQNESCKGCVMNEFGSAANGRGKKCTDYKMIAFMLPDAKAGDPIFTAKISPTGLKEFSSFVSRMTNRYGLPTYAYSSQLGTKPAGSSLTITVAEKEPLNSETLQLAMSRQAEALKMLLEPISFSSEETKK